jgi:hypothetical protein
VRCAAHIFPFFHREDLLYLQVEKNKYFLVNLNADPSLNELLVYYLKNRSLVGREDAAVPQDIQLSGEHPAVR